MKELDIPSAAIADPKAIELLRVWAANNEQHVSIATHVWDDPGAWGIMLADLAQHISIAYEASTKATKEDILERVRTAFDAEFASPTDRPRQSS